METHPDVSNASRLRTLYRLRSGLPPAEHLDQLTSDASGLLNCARRLLSTGPADIRWMQVTGDYGEGKSHFLSVMRDLAHRQNYATCYLSCDGASSALNHPQRFLPGMLSTLELPGSPIHGYEDLLCDVLQDAEHADRVKRVVGRYLPEMSPASGQAWHYLHHLVRLLNSEHAEEGRKSEERTVYARAIVQHLTGQSIRHRLAEPGIRRGAYALIQAAADLLVAGGLRGLVLLIDEVESVFTKLPNTRSRQGAYRVLSALCESTLLRGCRVVLAVTPDARRRLIEEAPSRLVQPGPHLPCEPVAQWARRLVGNTHMTAVCRPLDRSSATNLIGQVRELYVSTYPHLREHLGEDEWLDFVKGTLARGLPVRLLVRQTVDFLDGKRYRVREGEML